MLEALIAGQRDPKVLAELTSGRLRVKHAALVRALTGRLDDHHAVLARMLLDQIDALSGHIDQLTALLEQTIAAIPPPSQQPPALAAAQAQRSKLAASRTGRPPAPSTPKPANSCTRPCRWWTAWTRSPGSAATAPRSSSPRSGWTWASPPPLGTWCRGPGCHPGPSSPAPPATPAPPARATPPARPRRGRPPPPPPRPTPSLGERYRRLVRRIGKRNALVAIARSILVIVWHLLADPTARFHDLGANDHARRIDRDRKTRNLVHQLQALGHKVTLQPAA